MARDASSLVKRNGKLEAFLARQLDRDQYERIRSHESCIVCNDKEDKAFKFVILSDEWISLSENPPKKLVNTVHLQDVVSIDLKNDFAEFLSGAERDNTQHIVIDYYEKEQKRKKSKKNASGTPRTSRTLSTRSSSSQEQTSPRKSSRSIKSKQLSASQPSTSRNTTSMKERSSKENQTPPRKSSLGAETLRDALEHKTRSRKPSKRNKSDNADISDGKRSPVTTSKNLASTMLNRLSSSRYKNAQNLPRPLPNPADDFDENGELIDKRKKAPLRLGYSENGELKISLEQPTDEESSEEETDDSESDYDDDLFTTPSSSKSSLRPPSVPKIQLHTSTDSDDTSPRMSFSDESCDSGAESEAEARTLKQMHVYILNFTSPFLMLLRAAWNNFLIRGTLQKNQDYYDKTMCYTPRRALGISCELDQLFNQMKNELLHTNPNDIEKVFKLVNEMKNAADRFFALKKLFWKTSELFKFLVHQLQRYLPKSPHCQDKMDHEEYKELRADEFELVILVMDTLSMMFRETEVIPTRLQMLKAGQGKTVLDLLVVITCDADVPTSYLLAVQPDADEWQSATDADLLKLSQEFISSATTLLAELIIIAHMANWGDSDGCFFNISWIVKVLQELSSTEKFITAVVEQTMKLIWPSRREYLEPHEAVLLYQQFTVLQTLLEYSTPLSTYIRHNFHEEFKYYIQAPVICDKLRSRYPITHDTIKLIEEVMGSVLKKKIYLTPGANHLKN